MGSTEHQRQIIDTFVNSVYVFDDRVVLNFNFTDDAKMVTREEVLETENTSGQGNLSGTGSDRFGRADFFPGYSS